MSESSQQNHNMDNELKPKLDRKPSIVIENITDNNSLLSVKNTTGFGRTRVSLKPGHSLIDWINLCSKSSELTGTDGQAIDVTLGELQKHNTVDDCWICIRGNVYNVTPFLHFHPGGVEEIMRGSGSDATNLFNENHRYVNYESMLKKCYVGSLNSNA